MRCGFSWGKELFTKRFETIILMFKVTSVHHQNKYIHGQIVLTLTNLKRMGQYLVASKSAKLFCFVFFFLQIPEIFFDFKHAQLEAHGEMY